MASVERYISDAVPAPDVAALVALAREGDQDAWESLYRLVYPRLLAYARRRLDAEAARDAVSEAMTRAVAAIDRFEWRGAGFDGWVFGILRHVVLDAQRAGIRGAQRLRAVPVDGTAHDPAPDHRLLVDEEAAAVRRAFERLSEGDRELLELRVVAGLSSEDVAAVLGRRAGAVRMAQARALERLRRLLTEQEGDA